MAGRKRICFVSSTQWGYLVDLVKHAEYFCNKEYDVRVICLDQGRLKHDIFFNGLEVEYIQAKNNFKFFRLLFFSILSCFKIYREGKVVFYYHPFVFLSSVIGFNGSRFFMDVRTGSVSHSNLKRRLSNSILKFNSFFFKNILVIDEGLARYLKLNSFSVVPLGADTSRVLGNSHICYRKEDKKVFLYIGTLSGRRLDEFIKGLSMYMQKYQDFNLIFNVVGDGLGQELQDLKSLVSRLGMSECVNFLGRLPHQESMNYITEADYGVAYVPVIDCYQYQPPTKIYEYGMAGLPILATKTFANISLMSDDVGVLVNDTPSSVCEGVREIIRKTFYSEVIMQSFASYTWEASSADLERALLDVS